MNSNPESAPPEPAPQLLSRRDFIQTSALTAAAFLTSGSAKAASLQRVSRIAIHPSIGITRVGNSEDSFFFGPEIPGELPHARNGFKDSHGAMAKQAARFRIYGYDSDGQVVHEIRAQDAEITWKVDVANSKAAWYEVNEAFDLPDAPAVTRRNATVHDRSKLVVEATQRTLRGASAPPAKLNGGKFHTQEIILGEVLTDARGRLVFLPGSGAAYSTPDAPPLGGFADNDGWTDDVCDGPIRATVRLGDREFKADPAWVISSIPNYAPGIATGLVTLYDVIYDMEVEQGRLGRSRPNFEADIFPIFKRLVDLQWVNAGFYRSNGFGSDRDFTSARLRRQLEDNSEANRAFRAEIFREFRNPDFATVEPDLVPQLYGDGTSFPTSSTDPRQWLSITTYQYGVLRKWARGHFDTAPRTKFHRLEDVPLRLQPATLDRASLDGCLGGAFHPGIEFPWLARVPSIWQAPFRLKLRSLRPDLHDWGRKLTAEIALSPDGPLDGCTPGDITRWLGIPWHADGASCRSGYQSNISPIYPSFWPARVPTQVLSEADYNIVMDQSRPLEERRRAFARRRDWERFIARPTRPPTLALMVKQWYRQGLILARPGPDDGYFPKIIKVESHVEYSKEPAVSYPASDWVPQGSDQ